jgi:hypothetical protein
MITFKRPFHISTLVFCQECVNLCFSTFAFRAHLSVSVIHHILSIVSTRSQAHNVESSEVHITQVRTRRSQSYANFRSNNLLALRESARSANKSFIYVPSFISTEWGISVWPSP